MISRSHRLTVKQFEAVMKKGRVAHSPLFLYRVLASVDGTRVAAVAPRKSYPTAVARNSTRRAIYRAIQPMINDISTVEMILVAKQGVDEVSTDAIQKELKEFFVKSNLLR